MKKLLYFIIPLIIGVLFAFGLNKFLDHENSKLMKEKNLVPLMGEYSSDIKDKGVLINNELLSKNNIMILGSSELSNIIKRQHAATYFNSGRTKNGLFTVGRPYNQTLQETLILGSTNPDIDNKKVVIFVSMQAFLSRKGVPGKDFQSLFSPTQFYEFLNNNNINKETKDYLARRVASLLKSSDEYSSERVYAELYTDNSTLGDICSVLFKPYFFIREKEVMLKEKGLLYLKLKKLNNKNKTKKLSNNSIDWKREDEIAYKEGQAKAKGNKYKIDYNNYKFISKKLPKMKNAYSKINLLKSQEVDDYKNLLNTCKELGVKPTIVLLPNADWYYDYTGITKDKRTNFYKTLEELASKDGFKVINLQDKEPTLKNNKNTDYYLRDIMHLGTRGCVDISERIYKEYNQGQIPVN